MSRGVATRQVSRDNDRFESAPGPPTGESLLVTQAAGEVRRDVDPRGVAHLMYTLLLGTLAQSLLDEPASTAPQSARVSAVDAVFAGIRTAPATPRTTE